MEFYKENVREMIDTTDGVLSIDLSNAKYLTKVNSQPPEGTSCAKACQENYSPSGVAGGELAVAYWAEAQKLSWDDNGPPSSKRLHDLACLCVHSEDIVDGGRNACVAEGTDWSTETSWAKYTHYSFDPKFFPNAEKRENSKFIQTCEKLSSTGGSASPAGFVSRPNFVPNNEVKANKASVDNEKVYYMPHIVSETPIECAQQCSITNACNPVPGLTGSVFGPMGQNCDGWEYTPHPVNECKCFKL